MVTQEPLAVICGSSALRACGFASSAARRRDSASWISGSLCRACWYTSSNEAADAGAGSTPISKGIINFLKNRFFFILLASKSVLNQNQVL